MFLLLYNNNSNDVGVFNDAVLVFGFSSNRVGVGRWEKFPFNDSVTCFTAFLPLENLNFKLRSD